MTRILCTLGPASLHPDVIAALDAQGVDLFRINLSHTPPHEVAGTIELVQRHSSTPLCLDTEGPQVRCGPVTPGLVLTTGQTIMLTAGDAVGTTEVLQLRPAATLPQLSAGSVVRVDFDGVTLQVSRPGRRQAEAIVLDGGRVGSNKAVTIEPAPNVPALSGHDLDAIELSLQYGIRHFALSFAGSGDDVARLRALLPSDAHVMAKIESRAGVERVDQVTSASDAVVIDRGDLSREVPIEYVPIYQKHIIRRANAWNKPVFVATNLLESMVVNRAPTLAEANDIINTLFDGAHGLVLAAETAVGSNPVQCVEMVLRLVRAFEDSTFRPILDRSSERAVASGGVARRSHTP